MLEKQFEEIDKLYEDFKTNHLQYVAKGTKAAEARARMAIGDIKKLVTAYRKESVDATTKKEDVVA